MNWRNKV